MWCESYGWVRDSEAERLSDDALFLGKKAVYQDLF